MIMFFKFDLIFQVISHNMVSFSMYINCVSIFISLKESRNLISVVRLRAEYAKLALPRSFEHQIAGHNIPHLSHHVLNI